MGIFKKSHDDVVNGKIKKLMDKQPYKKEIESNPDRFVVGAMSQDIAIALIVDKDSTTPDEFAKASKMLSEKFSEEVATKVVELYVDFCEKYGVTPFRVNTKAYTEPFVGYYSKLMMDKMMGDIVNGKR